MVFHGEMYFNTSVSPDQFCCPICLDILKVPVAIPCGHSFCMVYITDCWNQEDDDDDDEGVYSCPQCRQAFTPRPVLSKNTILAEMVDKQGKATQQTASPAHCYAGYREVKCNLCAGRKSRAVTSCLMFANSYSQVHLEQHERFFKYKKHHLMEATERLQKMICETIFDHRSYLIHILTGFYLKNKIYRQFEEIHSKYLEDILRSGSSERVFTELIHSFERRRSEDLEEAAVSQAELHMRRLESAIRFLKGRDAKLEQLSHIYYLQNSGYPVLHSVRLTNITVSSQLSFDSVGKSVSLLREMLEDSCSEEMEQISARVKCIQIASTSND